MLTQDLHTHSTFDDGKSTLREMAEGACRAGLTSLGFSLHSPLPFENSWACPAERVPDFFREAEALRNEFRGRLAIYIGVELDGESRMETAPFDYVIGSLHHVPVDGRLFAVDESAATSRALIRASGGADAAAERYFAQYDRLAGDDRVDIVGHFDLLTKFNEPSPLFDPNSPRYLAAAEGAMRKLVAAGKIFELNTGAISRGYRTAPYPSETLLRPLHQMGGRITLNSDAHSADALAFRFAEAAALAKRCGFTELWRFDGRAFVPVPLEI